MATTLTEVPPHDKDAEAAVLSAMFMGQNVFAEISEYLKEEHFYLKQHKIIYRAMQEMFNDNIEIDLVTLVDKLRKMDKLKEVGGTPYVSDIYDIVTSPVNAKAHANIVYEKSILRQLINSSRIIIDECYHSDRPVKQIVDETEKRIFDITQSSISQGFVHISELINVGLEEIEQVASKRTSITGIPSGFPKLDNATGGFHPEQLIIIAGRPSMGKTAFALNIAFTATVHHNKKVGIFSIEMSRDILLFRMLSSAAEVSLKEILHGYNLNQEKIFRITTVARELAKCPLFIDDSGGNTMQDIRSKSRRLKAEQGLDLLIIDYLQLMIGKGESRQQEISSISRQLKLLSKELKVPIITISQLSRAPEMRSDKRPILSDLRESGSIEQDADLVMFIYRDEYYNQDTEDKGKAEILVRKNRNGPQTQFKTKFIGEFTSFRPDDSEM
ncbi:MAG: replicative DNA helicase [Candidatus Cloacimonadota bacterium]|nr:MAG: replicative DNA helicase [Candidatus Cloacimonadota bacterium]